MTDTFNLALLVVTCAGSMAFGVLAAYALLRTGFALMRTQQPVPVKVRSQVARVS